MVKEKIKQHPQISLKAARVNSNLTQEGAAKKLNIDRSTLQNYESGKTTPPWVVIEAMEELYSIDKDYIFFGKKNRN